MDKDFLKFMSFVAFMEAKKEAERDCSAEDTGWQDTIPTIRRKPDPATEALLLSRIRMPEKPVNKMGSGEKVFMGIGIIGLFGRFLFSCRACCRCLLYHHGNLKCKKEI